MSKKVDGTKMVELASYFKSQLPGIGFALLVFDFHTPGIAHYISNANREDMIKALEEKVQVLKNKKDFPNPNFN